MIHKVPRVVVAFCVSAFAYFAYAQQTLTTTWDCAPTTASGVTTLTCTSRSPITLQWPSAANLTASANSSGFVLSTANTSFTCSPSVTQSPTNATQFDVRANCINKPGDFSVEWRTTTAGFQNQSVENFTTAAQTSVTYTLNASGGGGQAQYPQGNSLTFGGVVSIAPTGCGVTASVNGNAIVSGASVSGGQSVTFVPGCSSENGNATTYVWSVSPSSAPLPQNNTRTPPAITPFASGATSPTSLTYTLRACNETACHTNVNFVLNLTGSGNQVFVRCPAGYTLLPAITTLGAVVVDIRAGPGVTSVLPITLAQGKRIQFSYASIGQPGTFRLGFSKTAACALDDTSAGYTTALSGGSTLYTSTVTTANAPFSGSAPKLDAGTWYVTFQGAATQNTGTAQVTVNPF